MPNCFTLTPKGDTEPMALNVIDDMMCHDFMVTPHPTNYYQDWYGCIGFRLATGSTFDKMKEEANKDTDSYLHQMLPIIEWLDNHFISNAWVER